MLISGIHVAEEAGESFIADTPIAFVLTKSQFQKRKPIWFPYCTVLTVIHLAMHIVDELETEETTKMHIHSNCLHIASATSTILHQTKLGYVNLGSSIHVEGQELVSSPEVDDALSAVLY